MRGFTLIELMVVIAIIAILIIIAVPSYNAYNNNQKLVEAANQLQTVLRQAQNNAQTGTQCNPRSSSSKAIYWYIELSSDGTQYTNTHYILGTLCENGSQAFLPTALTTGVTISNISISGCSVTAGQRPRIRFYNVTSNIEFIDPGGCPDPINSNLEITLSLSGVPRTVRIEKGGGIYVNQ